MLPRLTRCVTTRSAAERRGAAGGGGSEALGDVARPLPGLDLATLLDASAYHTTRDAPARIRSGTLQARTGSPQGLHHARTGARDTIAERAQRATGWSIAFWPWLRHAQVLGREPFLPSTSVHVIIVLPRGRSRGVVVVRDPG